MRRGHDGASRTKLQSGHEVIGHRGAKVSARDVPAEDVFPARIAADDFEVQHRCDLGNRAEQPARTDDPQRPARSERRAQSATVECKCLAAPGGLQAHPPVGEVKQRAAIACLAVRASTSSIHAKSTSGSCTSSQVATARKTKACGLLFAGTVCHPRGTIHLLSVAHAIDEVILQAASGKPNPQPAHPRAGRARRPVVAVPIPLVFATVTSQVLRPSRKPIACLPEDLQVQPVHYAPRCASGGRCDCYTTSERQLTNTASATGPGISRAPAAPYRSAM
jgi:hypothetical protein